MEVLLLHEVNEAVSEVLVKTEPKTPIPFQSLPLWSYDRLRESFYQGSLLWVTT